MIHQLLKQLGLSDKEIQIYLAILQHGKATPVEIARATKINRSTVYNLAGVLAEKGIVSEDLGGKTKYLVARPPKDLSSLINKEKKKLDEKEKLVQEAIKELQAFTKDTKYSIPKIVFIGDDDLENYLYKQSPIWNESIVKKDKTATWWGFQDRHFVSHYEGWIDWYWESSAPKDVSLKLLSNESAEEIKSKKFPRRKIKVFNANGDFTSTLWINGDYVIMIVCAKRPHYLVEIHDEVLAHNMREVFKGIWGKV
jgi:sugar-specific transcriptional regulator TrmB